MIQYFKTLTLFFIIFYSSFAQNQLKSEKDIPVLLLKVDDLLARDELKEASGVYNDIALFYWEKKDLNLAVDYFNKSYKLNEKLNSEGGMAMISSNLAMIYCDKNQYEKGIEYFNKVISYRRSTGDKVAISSNLINISIAENNLKKFDSSVEHLEEALKLSMEINDTKQMRACYGMLAETYEKMGNVEKTMHYFKFYKSFNDLVGRKQEKEFTKKIADNEVMLLKLENESHKKELDLLRKQGELTALSDEMQLLYENVSKKELVLKLKDEEAKAIKIEIEKEKEKNFYEEKIINYLSWGAGTIILLLIGLLMILYYIFRFRTRTNQLLKIRNAEIIEQKTKIELANVNKDKLLSILGHDLRGPFATFKNLIQLMDMKVLSTEDAVEHIKNMSSVADSTLLMLDNTLIWARGQAQGSSYSPENISIKNITKEILDFLNETAKLKNIELIDYISDDIITFSDENQVRIILRNLLSNAIKFTPSGGKISVGAQKLDDSFTAVRVTDSGVGMKPEDCSKLFGENHFTKSGTQNEKGTGLGLLLCKEYIEANGGTIEVSSELNKGTTFAFTLKNSDNRTQKK